MRFWRILSLRQSRTGDFFGGRFYDYGDAVAEAEELQAMGFAVAVVGF